MNTREQEKTTPSKPRRFPRTAAVIHKIVGDDKKVFLSRVLFLLGPLVALFQVELLNETNPYLNLEPDEFLMNMVWYAIAFFISWLIFGRRRRAAVAACCFFEVIGIINHYVLEFRGRILFPHDITAIRTAVNVVDDVGGAAARGSRRAASCRAACRPLPPRSRGSHRAPSLSASRATRPCCTRRP